MIPRTIHRFWHGPKVMPESYVQYGEDWAALNPGWEVKLWTEDNLPPLLNQSIYDELGNGATGSGVPRSPEVAIATQRADVVGYDLVAQFGGVYVNCDMQPLQPLSVLLDQIGEDKAFAGYEDRMGNVCNAVLGGTKDDRFWATVVNQLGLHFPERRHLIMEHATGPGHLTRIASILSSEINLVMPDVFYPVHFSQVANGGDAADYIEQARANGVTIALHHWGHRNL